MTYLDHDVIDSQAKAWLAVVRELTALYPGWDGLAPTGVDAAIAAIRGLRDTRPTTGAMTPELKEVLNYYDEIAARAPIDDTEWDFVMTAAEYRQIREAIKE